MEVIVSSPNVKYTENFIEAKYEYQSTKVEKRGVKLVVIPQTQQLSIRTNRKVPRLGVMLVGWGGNNGSTFTATVIANRLGLSWPTRKGVQESNWYGSITQASTIRLGSGQYGEDVHIPLKNLLPMVEANDLQIDGWDISSASLAESVERAQVLEPALKQQLKSHLASLKPKPSVYDVDFIASNQASRADNLIMGTKLEKVQILCRDIENFKRESGVDKVIILWTANTERFCDILPGVHDTAQNLKTAIANNHPEISPSTLFAYAAISMKCVYINGSPQNTFVPGIIEMAENAGVFIAGDDFKSGQTKLKSVLVDFLVTAGIKPVSIVSYNHLGNNDGKNLSSPKQFKSKEISKSNVVDDVVECNNILYKPGEKPDHCVVIKYVPYVGDSKRAMDEYISEIMMGGLNTIVVHNTCEDSLLATPIILDLVLLAELCTRIQFKTKDDETYSTFHPVLSILSYLCKAPLVPKGTPVINALFKQRACIENVMRACLGLPPDSNMLLEHKVATLMNNVQRMEPYNKKLKVENGDN